MNRRRPLIAAVAASTAIVLIASCSSSSKKGGTSGTNPPPPSGSSSSSGGTPSTGPALIKDGYTVKGGTVNILVQANFEHLDPVQNYVTNSGNVGKLIYRTLTVFDDTPGKAPVIKADIAVKSGPGDYIGIPNKDQTVWTYKIQKGLKFQDGSAITAADIKYNVERLFAADVYKDGATYLRDLLVNSNNYAGPYKDPNKDLTSVQTPDPYTLVFHFASGQPDADMMMSLFYTAPVPKAKDTKQDYDFKPVSSGPYMITKYTPNKELVLGRNPNWSAATDPNRPALPDSFDITMGIAPATVSQRLIANQGSDQSALSIDNSSDIQPGDVSKLQGAKDRFVNGAGPCVFYNIFNENKIKDADVRHAFALALNRQAAITALNGTLFGSIPSSFIAANVRGFQPANLGLKDTGDIPAAKALLQGKTVPKSITYGYSQGRPAQKALALQWQSDLKKLGVNVTIQSIPTDSFYKTLRTDPGPVDIALAGWCWDWPTMASIVPPVLGPDATQKTWSTSNFSKYFDSVTAKQITALAGSTEAPATVDQQFATLANQIQTTNWPFVPTQAALNPILVGSKIHNVGVSGIWSLPDLNIIGVEP